MTHKYSGKLSNYLVLQVGRTGTERKEHCKLKSCLKWVTELRAELQLPVIHLEYDFQLQLYSMEADLWSHLFLPEDFSSILTLFPVFRDLVVDGF